MANVELLDKVMRHIEHNEHLWNQNAWANITVNGWSGEELKKMLLDDPKHPICGTQRCFAGHTVAFEGWTPVFDVAAYTSADLLEDGLSANWCEDKEGRRAYISTKAIELLEISEYDGGALFEPANDLQTLRSMVDHLIAHGDLSSWSRTDECGACNGSGEVTDECYACGHESEVECYSCHGSGEVERFAH